MFIIQRDETREWVVASDEKWFLTYPEKDVVLEKLDVNSLKTELGNEIGNVVSSYDFVDEVACQKAEAANLGVFITALQTYEDSKNKDRNH